VRVHIIVNQIAFFTCCTTPKIPIKIITESSVGFDTQTKPQFDPLAGFETRHFTAFGQGPSAGCIDSAGRFEDEALRSSPNQSSMLAVAGKGITLVDYDFITHI